MKKILCLLVTALLSSFLITSALAATTAEYKMTFVPTWNSASHPYQYPKGKGHFSGLIGATHKVNFFIFEKGMKPTPGLELLAERGMHPILAKEINAAIKSGKAGTLIETKDALRGEVHKSVTTTFNITKAFPYVSVVAMVAPSPDWFVGISRVKLYQNGEWVPTVTKVAYAWDAGSDNGTTYLSPDKDANPKGMTKLARTKQFMKNGKLVPVGVFVFTRIPFGN